MVSKMARPKSIAKTTGTAKIIPYPLARRRVFVERHARIIASMDADAGERYLQRQLLIQFDTLERKGVACDVIEREVLSLRSAIRAAVWKAVLMREPS
jgi:Family of unknown function (DUF6074)